MKRKIDHPAPSERALNGPRYWRSLDELAESPGFIEQLRREFPQGAAELDGTDRRHFLKIMAASFALGGIGLAGCRRPEQNILPFGKSVEGIIPGLPQYYATSMPVRRTAIPLIAETHQGRPTKLEGNPSYALHGGSNSLTGQASILDLYDPDRATAHMRAGTVLSAAEVNDLLASLGTANAANGGAGLAFLAEESASPTRARLVTALRAKFPAAVWAEYEPVVDEAPAQVARAVFGADVKPLYRFAKAKRIVSIDADFLHVESGSLYYARSFSNGRRVTKPEDPMNRLYVAESAFTLTGSMADHRQRLETSNMLALIAALGARITGATELQPLAEGLTVSPKWVDEVAADLLDHRGESLVIVGAHLPPQAHAIGYAINAFLGNLGQTIDFVTLPARAAASISDLVTAVRGGAVRALVILGGNPVYNAPADLEWAAVQKMVPQVIRFSYFADETAILNPAATTHLAAAHYLESWGDARAIDGTIVPIQPMILPLFGGLTDIEVLARIAGLPNPDPYTLVHDTIIALAGGNGEQTLRKFLHDGVLEGSAYPVIKPNFNAAAMRTLVAGDAPKTQTFSRGNLEVRFLNDYKMDDGRFANNGWLQECPDPITKISWDNAIQVSPRLAKELKIDPAGAKLQVARKEENSFTIGKENAFVGIVTVGGRSIRGPIHIQPGLANYTIVLPLGYGRTATGHVGRGAGYDAYPLRTVATMHVATGATLTVTKDRALLANTQEHWSMEGRDLVREANLEEYNENPTYVREIGLEAHSPSILGETGEKESLAQRSTEIPRGGSLYKTPDFDYKPLHQWGMSIDLNTCIGCNSCVVACQAENNVPIVGKDQVLRGREMHWLRLDRYYSDGQADAGAFGGEGNREIPEDPQVSLQPMACVHCELAPCETVCPVNATVHDNEGLNVMAYNRCIGTRYCANNCPYKVRRFNFFDFNLRHLDSLYLSQLGPKGMPELVKMVKNPEVTVRMRGVMEKCTYCVQRIENGKIRHKVQLAQNGFAPDVAGMGDAQGRPAKLDTMAVPDGVIKTACQQTCPVDAIVFGNILDPESAVSKAKARGQDYELLGYLNTRPRTTYLGKLRNPNPKMPDYQSLPLSRVEANKKNGHVEHGGAQHAPHQTPEGHPEPGAETPKKTAMLKIASSMGGSS